MKTSTTECKFQSGDIIVNEQGSKYFIMRIGRNTNHSICYNVFVLNAKNSELYIDSHFNNIEVGFGHEQYYYETERHFNKISTMSAEFPKISCLYAKHDCELAVEKNLKQIQIYDDIIKAIDLLERTTCGCKSLKTN